MRNLACYLRYRAQKSLLSSLQAMRLHGPQQLINAEIIVSLLDQGLLRLINPLGTRSDFFTITSLTYLHPGNAFRTGFYLIIRRDYVQY